MITMGSCWASVASSALARGGTQLLGIRHPTRKNDNGRQNYVSRNQRTETISRKITGRLSPMYHVDRFHAYSRRHQQT